MQRGKIRNGTGNTDIHTSTVLSLWPLDVHRCAQPLPAYANSSTVSVLESIRSSFGIYRSNYPPGLFFAATLGL